MIMQCRFCKWIVLSAAAHIVLLSFIPPLTPTPKHIISISVVHPKQLDQQTILDHQQFDMDAAPIAVTCTPPPLKD